MVRRFTADLSTFQSPLLASPFKSVTRTSKDVRTCALAFSASICMCHSLLINFSPVCETHFVYNPSELSTVAIGTRLPRNYEVVRV